MAGLPSRILVARRAFYSQLVTHYRYRGFYADKHVRSNGCIQGCVFSIDDCDLFMRVFGFRLLEITATFARLHFDDTSARFNSIQELQVCITLTEVFDILSGQRCGQEKSLVVVGDKHLLAILDGVTLHGNPIKHSAVGKLVGATVAL